MFPSKNNTLFQKSHGVSQRGDKPAPPQIIPGPMEHCEIFQKGMYEFVCMGGGGKGGGVLLKFERPLLEQGGPKILGYSM